MLNNLQVDGAANLHQSRDHESIIIHSSSLSSPSSLIINEESPSSLSSVSSPQCSSSSSHSGRSSSSRSASPDINLKKSNSEEMSEKSEISSRSSTTSSTDHTEKESECNHDDTEGDHEGHEKFEEPKSVSYDSNNNKLVVDIKNEKIQEEKNNKNDLTEVSDKELIGQEDKRKVDDLENEDVEEGDSRKKIDIESREGIQKNQEPPSYDRYEAMQPRLKKFLKIYQLSSKNSLGGPTIQNDIENLKISKTSDDNLLATGRSISPVLNRNEVEVKEEMNELNGSSLPSVLSQTHQPINEHNNLSIIASVAAAAYFNQALNKQSLQIGSKLYKQESPVKDMSPPSHSQQSNDPYSRNGSNESSYYSHNHHHHHHHHPHKRAKYSSAFSKPAASAGHNKEREPSNTPNSGSSKSNVNYLKCVQADTSTSPLIETLLHGERISCFIVGGEKRLCLHDILNTILKDFSVQQINSACQKLQIACLESSIKQLEILKKNKLLPTGAPNCGLLTQTNAERLCAYLMDSSLAQAAPPQSPHQSVSPTGQPKSKLKVVHECFGKTYGHLHMNMYSRSDSACVECDTCHKMYTPKNFVCHSHRYESHTRHWGFDSGNWRCYLKLAGGGGSVVSSENSTGQYSTNGILSDIKVSNKDNIAANLSNASSSNKSAMHEEFENFKKKFLNKDEISGSGVNLNNCHNSGSGNISSIISSNAAQQMVDAMKRKMQPENININNMEIDSRHANKLLAHFYGNSENSTKRLMTSSSSLNDLNNNLMKNAISNSTNPNNSSNLNNHNKALNEHKLLNGLLSKPLGATLNSASSQNDQINNLNLYNNSQNSLLMPSNMNASLEQLLKMNNKINSHRSNSLTTGNNGNMPNGKHYDEMISYSKSNNNSLLGLIGQQQQQQQQQHQSKLHQSPPKDTPFAASRLLGSTGNSISSMEANMLEFILNEIDSCVENKESVDRLRQMITQMHVYFNEKLNELQLNRSKLIAEFDEQKINYQTENEQLRCQLKLLQIHSDMNKDSHFQKSSSQQFQQQHAQLNQMKQQEANAAAASLPYKQLQVNKTNPLNQQQHQNMLSAQHHFQMLLQHQAMSQQQQQQQQKSNSESLNAAAAVAAAQSFPQFFLNHYIPSLQQQQHRNIAIDPSGKLNKHGSQSSFNSSPPMSHSSSTSPAKSQSSTSLNMNSSHLHQTTA